MILVVDASVGVKWFLRFERDEDNADIALTILEQSVLGAFQLIQPPHFFAEVAGVLARLAPDSAQDDLFDLLNIDYRILDISSVYATALSLAIRYRHHLFDTIYHAVALNTPGSCLITADKIYYDKARTEGQVQLLSDFELTN